MIILRYYCVLTQYTFLIFMFSLDDKQLEEFLVCNRDEYLRHFMVVSGVFRVHLEFVVGQTRFLIHSRIDWSECNAQSLVYTLHSVTRCIRDDD